MIPRWFIQEIHEGDRDSAVWIVQRKVGAPFTGVLDSATVSRLRGIQFLHGLPMTGSVNAETAEILGEKATAGQAPAWFNTDAVEFYARIALRAQEGELEPLVRQFQSARGMIPTGIIDEETATALADRLE